MTMIRIAGLIGSVTLVAGGGFVYWAFGAFLPWREAAEAQRLFDIAGMTAGQTVAEIGAGTGRFTVAAARRVGPAGRVYSTELGAENRAAVQKRASSTGLTNISVVEAAPLQTNLPDACCNVVFMRNVYHHIGNPAVFTRSVSRAVQPGGALVVIDFAPGALWFHGGRPDDASERRPGHGVALADAVAEFTQAGFTLERQIDDWSGPMWMAVFRLRQ